MRYKPLLALVLLALLVAMAGCNGDDDGPEPVPETKLETGLELQQKTAGWAVTQAIAKARDWRANARLVYMEWRNMDSSGFIGEGDVLELYFSSEWSQKYYKVVVDVNGASDFDLGEVERSKVFPSNHELYVFNWTKDSDVIVKKALPMFKKDGETILKLAVLPAGQAGELEMSGNLAVVVVYSTERDLYFNGNTAALIEEDVVLPD